MTNLNSYQTLNLSEGASVSEIKAAFRNLAKAHHPDGGGRTPQDVERFIEAQTAYQKLMKKAVAHNRARRKAAASQAAPARPPKSPAAEWRFESRREIGLDVYYRLVVLRPADGQGRRLVLPWQVREACPRCLGQGRTLARVGQNSLYRPCACSKCEGRGVVERDSELEVNLTPEMVGQSKIRLRKAGLYKAQDARRGDLILDITWADHLPSSN